MRFIEEENFRSDTTTGKGKCQLSGIQHQPEISVVQQRDGA